LTHKENSGYSYEQTFDENNNLLTYKYSSGRLDEYTYNKTKDYFIVTKNNKKILKVPLKYIK